MFEIITQIINLGNMIGAPIKAAAEGFDEYGNLIDRNKAKNTAIIGGLFSPSKALETRSESGCWFDLTGDCYADYLEKQEKDRLQIIWDEQNALDEAERQKQELIKKILYVLGFIILLVVIYYIV